jgi:(R,R)-butanediol dehydrogenase / meso-butanediol dehydrogenase / diacetyl reductase
VKAARFYAARDLRLEDVPAPPEPRGAEVLVEIQSCGICGTDLHEYTHGPFLVPRTPHPLTGAQPPQILGHECAGLVRAVGPDVTAVTAGQRVSIMPALWCGECGPCREGQEELCVKGACFGLSADWGGLAEYALLPERNVVPIPAAMTYAQAALIEPAAAALQAVDVGDIKAGDFVLVTGGGPIGQLVALCLNAVGATVLVSEPAKARREQAAALGVLTHDPVAETLADHLLRAGRPAVDACIECSGSGKGLETCLTSVKPGGTVVQLGLFSGPVQVDIDLVVRRGIRLEGTIGWSVRGWPRMIDLIASGRIPVEKIVSDEIALEDVLAAGFERLLDPAAEASKVLVVS